MQLNSSVIFIIFFLILAIVVVSYLFGKSKGDKLSDNNLTDLYLKKVRDEIYKNPDSIANIHSAIDAGKKLRSENDDTK